MKIGGRNIKPSQVPYIQKTIKKIREQFVFTDLPVVKPYIPKGFFNATHISAFTYGNTGDAILVVVLRDIFNQYLGVKKWHGRHVYNFVSDDDITSINNDDFVVIGGGGLFLGDTAPNDNSGWQWNCSIDSLRKIRTPIIAFAIGYNRFRGQEEFKPIFKTFINEFVEKAKFVGLRNNGSVEKVRDYIDSELLREKVVFQPCITTLIWKLYPKLRDYEKKDDYIAFNCAFDRQDLRSINESILNSIARVAFEMSKVTKVKFFSHVTTDKQILSYLDFYSIPYEVIEFSSINQIIDYYSSARLVIGMRGHSQMVPFGCLTPIVSIISHDKMQWFLDDINHPDWGVDVLNNDFENVLHKKVKDAYENYDERIFQIKQAQNYLWNVTEKNMIAINKIVKNK